MRALVAGAVSLAFGGIAQAPALAQVRGPSTGTGNNLNIEHYDPPASPLGMLNILESESQEWREWSVGLYLHYARNPLVLFEDRLQLGEVVGHRISGDLVASVGFFEWLEIGGVLPFSLFQTGDEISIGDFSSAGLRDVRLHAKVTLLRQYRTGLFGIAIVPELSIPSGDDTAFLGDGNFTFTPQLVLDRSFDVLWGLRAAIQIGGRIRPRSEIGNIEIGDELFYRAGFGFGLPGWGSGRPEAIGEISGITGVHELFEVKEQNPLLGTLGLRAYFDVESGHQIVSTAGLTIGATRGYGAPDFQVFAGVAYRRYMADRDNDGILDDDDFCPDDPEDRDEFEDLDGCPDPDNDKDGIPDVADRCPLEKEDIDGFEDLDGCPEHDNDKDKILDADDRCPNKPEDYDGFQDEDGCPEPDNDLDGVPDAQDKCPFEKEVINGILDEDGCPDEGPSHVEVTSEKITIDTMIHFEFDSAVIKRESYDILNQVALTILANPQLRRIRVEGHCDERGGDEYNLELSQKRAESVMEYLIGRGVEAERLEAVGYGKRRPIDTQHTEEAWAKNRRVEFTILEQGPEPETGGRTLQVPRAD